MKTNLKTRSEKIQFLAGLKNKTRSVHELGEDFIVVNSEQDMEKAEASGRYKHIVFIPDNGRENPVNNLKKTEI